MRSPAVAHSSEDRYAIDLPLPVRIALSRLPEGVRGAIIRRLAEIAYVAASLSSWMTEVDDMKSTMHFEIAGYAVSYAMSDRKRSLQVLGVAQATDSGLFGKH
ncbi:MAG TPA: hypothetical protein VIG99_05470 [Myxococcaceae bacterium]|jgi:hypothetical protein